jgi:hypothetical protein
MLGRMTISVPFVADYILKRKDEIPDFYKNKMVKEARQAIEDGRAGMKCDVQTWEDFIKQLEE